MEDHELTRTAATTLTLTMLLYAPRRLAGAELDEALAASRA